MSCLSPGWDMSYRVCGPPIFRPWNTTFGIKVEGKHYCCSAYAYISSWRPPNHCGRHQLTGVCNVPVSASRSVPHVTSQPRKEVRPCWESRILSHAWPAPVCVCVYTGIGMGQQREYCPGWVTLLLLTLSGYNNCIGYFFSLSIVIFLCEFC